MKKYLLLFVAVLGSLVSSASHLQGGYLGWTALGNNQYVFYFQSINVCAMGGVSYQLSSNAFGTGGAYSSINLNEVQNKVINPCGSCTNYRFMNYRVYRSAPVTLPAPTTGPYHFYLLPSQGSNATVQEYSEVQMHGIMRVGGENKSSPRVNIEKMYEGYISHYYNFEPYSTEGDSVYTNFLGLEYLTSLMTLPNTAPATYINGHSQAYPTSPWDKWYKQTGAFYSGDTFSYRQDFLISARIEAFNNSNWYARGHLLMRVQQGLNGPNPITSVNVPPTATTSPIKGSWSLVDSTLNVVKANWGETLKLQISASDIPVGGQGQQYIIANSFDGSLAGTGYIKPTISPAAGQSSIRSFGTNVVNWEWTVPGGLEEGYYRFFVRFTDSNCSYPGEVTVPIEVRVEPMFEEEINICSGGGTSLQAPMVGSTYQWVPNTALSSDTSAQAYATPTADITYYCIVDGDTVGTYFVAVGQHTTPIATQTSSQIELTNPGDFDEHALLYYYMPIAFDDTVFQVNSTGIYHIAGRNAGCYDLSDSINFLPDTLSTCKVANRPLDPQNVLTLATGDYYELNFSSGYIDAAMQVAEVIVPGGSVSGKMGGIHMEYEDNSGVTQSIVPSIVEGHSLKFTLDQPTYFNAPNGSLKFVVDSGSFALPLFEKVSWSFRRNIFEFYTVSGTHADGNFTDELAALVFRGTYRVGLEEEILPNLYVYPQPTNGYIKLSDVEGVDSYQLLDISGRVLQSGEIERVIDISSIPSGLYVLRVLKEGVGEKSLRVMVQ